MAPPHRISVRLVGPRCEHDLCVPINRGVPPELRCADTRPQGYGGYGAGVPCRCKVPPDLSDQVERALRDSFQESKRRGYVLVRAA